MSIQTMPFIATGMVKVKAIKEIRLKMFYMHL